MLYIIYILDCFKTTCIRYSLIPSKRKENCIYFDLYSVSWVSFPIPLSTLGVGRALLELSQDDWQCNCLLQREVKPTLGKAAAWSFGLSHNYTGAWRQYIFLKWGNDSAISVGQHKTWFILFICQPRFK